MFVIIKLKTILIYTLVVTLISVGVVTTYAINKINNNIGKEIDVPILMYHSILKDPQKAGKYVISPKQLESDLMYIKDKGYNTILMADLINYVYNNIPLPEKPIMLTFDDGYYNNYYYAYPLFQKYNAKAVISAVGKYTDFFSDNGDNNPNYSNITWGQMKEMMASGLVEIQNHSYNLHSVTKKRNGTKKKMWEDPLEYKLLLYKDIKTMQDKMTQNTNYTPTTFTYPFGGISEESVEVLKEIGFKASLSCLNGINKISRDKEDLFHLKRILRPSGIKSEDYFEKILNKDLK